MEIKDKNGITGHRPEKEKEEAKIPNDIMTAFRLLNSYVTITYPDGDAIFSEEFRKAYKDHIRGTEDEEATVNVILASYNLLIDVLKRYTETHPLI